MASIRTERRLAAILAADVVGYSRLVEQDEEGTLAAVRDIRSAVVDPLLAEHRGRIVKLMGDGLLAEFGSVVDAVACALAIQAATAARQDDILPERWIVFRIGINLGDVVVEGEDLLGNGVNIAARLEQLCTPGGVMISGTAYDHLKGKLNVPFDFAGQKRVKNISQPVRTYTLRREGVRRGWSWRTGLVHRWTLAAALAAGLLVMGLGLWWRSQRIEPTIVQPIVETVITNPIIGKPSIAVLPFDNLGGDDATGRLAAGVTEDIITDLSRYRDLDVMARNATAAYAGKPVDIRAVGKTLNVRYVLEGSIQRSGEQVRVTAQLIEADRGTHLWAERWDRPVTDVFAVQAEVAEQVGTRLAASGGAIPEAERAAGRRARPEDLRAYDLYRQGQEAMGHLTKDSVEEAIRWLEQAVDQDPRLARAWVALASAHDLTMRFGADADTARASAMQAIRRGVDLDPQDATAHATLGHILGMADDLPRAQAEFETALRLNPSDVGILTSFAGWASKFGEPERGAQAADRAMRLNPNYSASAAGYYRMAYLMAGRYEDALRLVEREDPQTRTPGGWVQAAVTYAALGRQEEARATVLEALKRYPDLTIESFALNSPGYSDAERQRLVEGMQNSGFPPCIPPERLQATAAPVHRLPECQTMSPQ
ncbi:adenylate/guanylate cyclase domain-containing protein [Microvirga calopogonii]|uniref:adenylate/guanylate cyclase domain-containing protein n=1 Tax=Microvirga calopogonii TaxID=2078013 RepID=UPI000E0CF31E|nr:adenylate/guanylate cyclase domain-containing protein [Microvirga calopogonii]